MQNGDSQQPAMAVDLKTDVAASPRKSRLWLWFVAAFALQLAAWIAWFVIAAHHPVEQVPLVQAVGGKR
jgi:hypothetical protein